jgi:hypothetical protein
MVGVAQLVEHLVVVQDVAGSTPVTHPRGTSNKARSLSKLNRGTIVAGGSMTNYPFQSR